MWMLSWAFQLESNAVWNFISDAPMRRDKNERQSWNIWHFHCALDGLFKRFDGRSIQNWIDAEYIAAGVRKTPLREVLPISSKAGFLPHGLSNKRIEEDFLDRFLYQHMVEKMHHKPHEVSEAKSRDAPSHRHAFSLIWDANINGFRSIWLEPSHILRKSGSSTSLMFWIRSVERTQHFK